MTCRYLSPAFSDRTDEEIEFLRELRSTSGFSLFWIDIVQPLLKHIKALHLLEVGAYHGDNTRLLIRYCDSNNGMLTVIEPAVLPSLEEVIRQAKRVRLLAKKSRDAFSHIECPVDAVLLEGDLNYHTVYGDLAAIESMAKRHHCPFPTIVLRATGWPYARRDMYYDPQSMQAEQRNSYSYSGMTPWSSGLEADMINYPFANAEEEGGARNGVLTAAESFIQNAESPLGLLTLPIHNGVSIIYLRETESERFIREHIGSSANLLIKLLETVEVARLNSITAELDSLQQRRLANDANPLARLKQHLHRIIDFIFNRMR